MIEGEFLAVAALRHLRLLFAHDRRASAGDFQPQPLIDDITIARELEFVGVGAGSAAVGALPAQGGDRVNGTVRRELLGLCRRQRGGGEDAAEREGSGHDLSDVQHFGLGSA